MCLTSWCCCPRWPSILCTCITWPCLYLLITALFASPGWHRRQTRARANARALLRCCTKLDSPIARTAVGLLEVHHGSTLPAHIRDIVNRETGGRRQSRNMAWICAWCRNRIWKSRQNCWKCKLTPEQARAECAACVPPLPIGRVPCCQAGVRPLASARPDIKARQLRQQQSSHRAALASKVRERTQNITGTTSNKLLQALGRAEAEVRKLRG